MANVYFSRGTQASLNSLPASKKVDGTFYLTTDTNRLYVAKNIGTESAPNVQLVELNQSINIVAAKGNLPTNTTAADIGQFYYISGDNILCVYTGQTAENSSGWTQINPDTQVAAHTLTVGAGTNANERKVTSRVSDNHGSNFDGNFTIAGGEGLIVSNSGNVITITPDFDTISAQSDTTYTLSAATESNAVKIKLDDNHSLNQDGDSSVVLSGEGAVSVRENNGEVIIGASTDSVTTANFNANGVLSISTLVGSGNPTAGTVTPVIKLGSNVDEYKFISNTATLPVYTKTEVDTAISNALSTADAMTYKGTVSSSDAATKLNKSNAVAGDTYKASTAIDTTVSGQVIGANVGDLIIAGGSDSNIVWEVIPSGDDQVITGTIRQTGITIADTGVTATSGTIAAFDIEAATNGGIVVTGEVGTGVNSKHTTISIAQASNYTAVDIDGPASPVTQSGNQSASFTALTGIETDSFGNVISVDTQTLNVVDTHNLLTSVTTSVGAATTGTGAKVTVGAVQSDGEPIATGNFSLVSDNLTITSNASNNTVTANFVWGEF